MAEITIIEPCPYCGAQLEIVVEEWISTWSLCPNCEKSIAVEADADYYREEDGNYSDENPVWEAKKMENSFVVERLYKKRDSRLIEINQKDGHG